jgi:integrase
MDDEVLKVPAKYNRCGIKVKCLKCKYQVSAKCGSTGKAISSCENKNQHRYNLLVCVPNTPGARRTRILKTANFNEALVELTRFKEELQQQGYHKQTITKVENKTTLNYFMTAYLDAVSGVNTPVILIRERSKQHIGDSLRAFKRFRISLKKVGYNFDGMNPENIKDQEVSIYHEYLLNDLKLGQRSYNKHMGIMKTLFNWIKRVKDQHDLPNTFNHVELTTVKTHVSIINKSEFEKLLDAITVENSLHEYSGKYYYRDWLIPAYRLALETGLRREELLTLNWSDIVPVDDGKLVCRIPNLKVNRIMKGRSSKEHMKYIPVTKSLLSLLKEMGYDQHKESDDRIIERPDQSLEQAKGLLSRAFSHFNSFTDNQSMMFGVLRKTYITKLTIAAGPNAKLFTGSSSDQVLLDHYISSAYIAASLDDFEVL